jgi:hypothetical protein
VRGPGASRSAAGTRDARPVAGAVAVAADAARDEPIFLTPAAYRGRGRRTGGHGWA